MKSITLLLICLLLYGCQSLSYYGQAVSGQLSILSQRRDIDRLLEEEALDPALQDKLSSIMEIRVFAEQELGLPVGRNFGTYVDLQRPFVVWNVFAAPAFSLQPRQWCYPVAGCVSYRGYFREEQARAYAAELKKQQYDVYVGGVAAYSTLGWFADPVLSTVIGRADYQLAALIFHELAHQLVYVSGDTVFNESFATAVAEEGLRRWLERAEAGGQAEVILSRARLDRRRRQDFVALVKQSTERLELLYQSAASGQEKRLGKQAVFRQMREDYATLKTAWGGYGGYDAWFAQELNNAQLNTVATYYDQVPAFQALLVAQQYDLKAFYREVRMLARLPAQERGQQLGALVAGMPSGL